jgi:hypothetical protein
MVDMDHPKTFMLLALSIVASCHSGEQRIGGDVDRPDVAPDTDWDATDPAEEPPPTDVLEDVTHDAEPDSGPCTAPPPCPEGPADGVLGRACLGDGACDEVEYARCWGEVEQFFEGEMYIQNRNGTCQLWTGGGLACDPEDDSGCPRGSRCIESGRGFGIDWYGCIDACTPADTSGELYDWSCGCRVGYECNLFYGVCLSGCSNDRECCETWHDANHNAMRDSGEVTLFPGCSNYCDGDDPEETTDCMASYACVNLGTPGSRFGDPCEHDSHCPVDGACWAWRDPDTGEEYYPGGYCSRMGCNYAGRGCEDAGGACINSGGLEDPRGFCVRPCHTGSDATDSDFECRRTPGQEHACFPVSSWAWVGGPPAGGEDGYCFPGNYGAGTGGLGDACEDGGECASPLGLGECADWWVLPFCTVRCNETLAVDEGICGPAGTGGVATGICGWNMCWPGCDTPGGALGANGCGRVDFACAPLSTFDSATYVVDGATRPLGFCMPMCETHEQCEGMFGPGSTCDSVSGLCS